MALNDLPGADARYRYKSFKDLNATDRRVIKTSRYHNGSPWLPDEEYLYPIKKDGRLANARRCFPHDRAVQLYQEYTVQEIMGS